MRARVRLPAGLQVQRLRLLQSKQVTNVPVCMRRGLLHDEGKASAKLSWASPDSDLHALESPGLGEVIAEALFDDVAVPDDEPLGGPLQHRAQRARSRSLVL